MDTKDPRFVNAYNDLVGAFFRFINVVNPAPTKEDQIRLICNSMTTLIDMIKDGCGESFGVQSDSSVYEPTQYHAYAPAEASSVHEKPSQSIRVNNVVSEPTYPEKRYAKEPTFTADEVYKFLPKQFKKEDAWEDLDEIDAEEFMFIVEFDNSEGKGQFYLNENKKANLNPVFEGSMESSVVKVEGNPKSGSVTIKSKGKIEKVNGGWEIISPLVITEK